MSSEVSVRIVTVDYYVAPPINGFDVTYSEFRGSPVSHVPTVRIFGSTAAGQTICLHVHGVFPYMYIPYDGSGQVNTIIHQISAEIDKSVNISLGQASSTAQHIYKITLVSGIPIYGFHARQHQFLKIYAYNPLILKKISQLLQSQAVIGNVYQPHESHIPFTMQFMIDYNLHGMSSINLSEVQFRGDTELKNAEGRIILKKVSHSLLEADVFPENILNRFEISDGHLATNPGIAALWEDEKQRLRNKKQDSQIGTCLSADTRLVEPTKSHLLFKQALHDRLTIMSDDLNVSKSSSQSVYPAETPESSEALDASFVDSGSINVTLTSQKLDETAEENDVLDLDAQRLCDVLQNLGDMFIEEGSILSQSAFNEDEKDETEDHEENLDLSIAMETILSQTELGFHDDVDEEHVVGNVTTILQVDGNNDSDSDSNVSMQSKFRDSSKYDFRKEPISPCNKNNGSMDLQGIHYESKTIDVKEEDTPFFNASCKWQYYDKRDSLAICSESGKMKYLIPVFQQIDLEQMKDGISKGISSTSETRRKRKHDRVTGEDVGKIQRPHVAKLFENRYEDATEKYHIYNLRSRKKALTHDAGRRMPKSYSNKDATNFTGLKDKEELSCFVFIPFLNMPKLCDSCDSKGILDQEVSCKMETPFKQETFSETLTRIKRMRSLTKNQETNRDEDKRLARKSLNKRAHNKRQPKTSSLKCGLSLKHQLSLKKARILNLLIQGLKPKFPLKPAVRPYVFCDGKEKSVSTENKESQFSANNYNNLHIHDNDLPDHNHCKKDPSIYQYNLDSNNLLAKYTFVHDCLSRSNYYLEKNNILAAQFFQSVNAVFSQKAVCFEKILKMSARQSISKLGCQRNTQGDICHDHTHFETSARQKQPSSRHIDLSRRYLDGTNDDTSSDEEVGEFEKTVNTSDIVHESISTEECKDRCNLSPSTQNYITKKERVKRKITFGDTLTTTGAIQSSKHKLSDSEKMSDPTSLVSVYHSPTCDDHNFSNSLSNANKDAHQIYKQTRTAVASCSKMMNSAAIIHVGEDVTKLLEVSSSLKDINMAYAPKNRKSTSLGFSESSKTDLRKFRMSNVVPSQNLQSHKCQIFRNDKQQSTLLTLFNSNHKTSCLQPKHEAPSKSQVVHSLMKYNIPTALNSVPFYGKADDVSRGIEVGFNLLRVNSKFSLHQPEFISKNNSLHILRAKHLSTSDSNSKLNAHTLNSKILSFCKENRCLVTPVKVPPTKKDIAKWCNKQANSNNIKENKLLVNIHYHHTPDEDGCNAARSQSPSFSTYNNSYLEKSEYCRSTIDDCDSSGVSKVSHNSASGDGLPASDLTISNESFSKTGEISGVTVNNTYGFNSSVQNQQKAKAVTMHSFLTVVIIELHISTRGELRPDPNHDSVRAIFYSVMRDIPSEVNKNNITKGIFAVNSTVLNDGLNLPLLNGTAISCDISYVESENHLLHQFADFIHHWDPDIIAGYEIEMLSLGYLVDRSYILGINLPPLISRIKDEKQNTFGNKRQELSITGRIILDVWRLLRHEIAVQSYTFENMLYHILHRRVPRYSFKTLTFWWNHRSGAFRAKCIKYYLLRVEGILHLLDKLDIIGRTCELAKLFGIQFYEVLSRGSQFRVESLMLRLAKPLNFIAVSPSIQQRAGMRAPEFLPLILEPESKLYTDPVIVLDFQSLYPSMMIAYNYCFSTCLGRVEHLGKNTPFEFGATQYKIPRKKVSSLITKDKLNFSPCGVAFVKAEVREGILPRMLREILNTRLMVKNSMKQNKDDSVLKKVLHNRQLGLKLIANVSYGYTAANYSGRMPSVEVADSVVSKGKETLQRAVSLVDETQRWGAKVVYGDTDSLFVLLPGKSREEAFAVGEQIADAVTNSNPNPVKLKLEKVYHPCILQTKKRYVGYMYESKDQKQPNYDAKGIETVRRDGCPAVSKILEKCLRILFESKDLSLIKQYVLKQFHKIISGRVSIQDLTFAKEYRGAAYYKPGACVPALELARKWVAVDKRSEPRKGERVPYVVISGPPGLPLIKLVRSPYDLLSDTSLRPNVLYYITQVIIPPINRCFNLFGVDVNEWFAQMPRINKQYLPNSSPGKRATISQYFATSNCIVCSMKCQSTLCDLCIDEVQTSSIILNDRIQRWENSFYTTKLICDTCTNSVSEMKCISLDCPVLYRLTRTSLDLQQAPYIRDVLSSDIFRDVS